MAQGIGLLVALAPRDAFTSAYPRKRQQALGTMSRRQRLLFIFF